MSGRSTLVTGLTAVFLTLSACQPLYIPPVPVQLERPGQLEFDASADVDDGRPRIRIELHNVPEEGWLAVQWFGPGNREVASESVWITSDDETATLVLGLPAEVEVRGGRWRAILSMNDRVLRQLSAEVP